MRDTPLAPLKRGIWIPAFAGMTLLLLSCAVYGANFRFVVGDTTGVTPCGDNMMSEAAATTNFGTATTNPVGIYSTPEKRRVLDFMFPTLSDTLALPAYAGTVDSLRLNYYFDTPGGDFGALDTFSLRVWGGKRVPSETQETWTVYTTGNNWSTAGALGSGTDQETSWESDGVHVDSILVAYGTPLIGLDLGNGWVSKHHCTASCTRDSGRVWMWLNPAHVSDETWIVRVSWRNATAALGTRLDVRMTELIGSNLKNVPWLEVYGHTVAAGTTGRRRRMMGEAHPRISEIYCEREEYR